MVPHVSRSGAQEEDQTEEIGIVSPDLPRSQTGVVDDLKFKD